MRSLLGRFHRPFARGTEDQLLLLNNLGDGSTLSLDFTTGVLDPRLTFTRLSNATFINSSGQVEWAAANMLANSVLAGASGITPPTGWQQSSVGGTPSFTTSGTAITISNNNSATRSRIYQNFLQGLAGVRVTVQFRVVANNTGGLNLAEVVGFSVGGSSGEIYKVNGEIKAPTFQGWVAGDVISLSCIPAAGANVLPLFGVGVQGPVSTSASITIADVQMNPGSTPNPYVAVTSTGTGYYAPRFDYDPTSIGTPRGLLIEGPATNLVLNGSMAYTATAPTSWVRGFSGCTVASVDSTTFLGQKAWSIAATASGQRDLLEQVISLAANTTYTVSVYLEAVTGTPATFAYMTSLPAGATSGTVVNPSAGRVSFTVTVGATAGNGTLRIGIGSASGTGVSADASVRFSHVQVEAGSGASSYIPTGASTGSRQADVCYMDGTNFSSWYNSAEGSIYIEWTGGAYALNANGRSYTLLNSAQTNQIFEGSGSALNVYLNTFQAQIGTGVGSAGPSGRVAGAFKQDDFAVSFNGGAVSTDTSGSMPTAVDRLSIGSNYLNAASFKFASIKRIKYWPTRLPNDQLQSLTT